MKHTLHATGISIETQVRAHHRTLKSQLAFPLRKRFKGRPLNELSYARWPNREALVANPGRTTETRVHPTELVATQREVDQRKVEQYRDQIRNGTGHDTPLVAMHAGRYHVLDGHHRVIASILEGVPHLTVRAMAMVLGKAGNDNDDLAAATVSTLDFSKLDLLVDTTSKELGEVYQDTGKVMLARLGYESNNQLIGQVFDNAVTWADAHAGDLIAGIKETTRDRVRDAIADALDEGGDMNTLIAGIQRAGIFDEARAELIARTETANANQQGALGGMKAASSTGLYVTKEWYPDANACDICLDNAAQGEIPYDEDFDSGDDAPTAHPNCECSLLEHSYASEAEFLGEGEDDAEEN